MLVGFQLLRDAVNYLQLLSGVDRDRSCESVVPEKVAIYALLRVNSHSPMIIENVWLGIHPLCESLLSREREIREKKTRTGD